MLDDGSFQGDTHVFNSAAEPVILASVVDVAPETPAFTAGFTAPADTTRFTLGKI